MLRISESRQTATFLLQGSETTSERAIAALNKAGYTGSRVVTRRSLTLDTPSSRVAGPLADTSRSEEPIAPPSVEPPRVVPPSVEPSAPSSEEIARATSELLAEIRALKQRLARNRPHSRKACHPFGFRCCEELCPCCPACYECCPCEPACPNYCCPCP